MKEANLPRVQFLIVEMSRKQNFANFLDPSFLLTSMLCFSMLIPILMCALMFVAAVTDIDTSGIHALEELHRSLLKRDVKVNTSTLIALYVSKNQLCKKLNTQNHITYSLETIHVYYILYELRDYLIESSHVVVHLVLANPGQVVIDKLHAS